MKMELQNVSSLIAGHLLQSESCAVASCLLKSMGLGEAGFVIWHTSAIDTRGMLQAASYITVT